MPLPRQSGHPSARGVAADDARLHVVGRAAPAQMNSSVDEGRDGDHRPLALAWRGRRERFVERRRRVTRV